MISLYCLADDPFGDKTRIQTVHPNKGQTIYYTFVCQFFVIYDKYIETNEIVIL